MFAQHCSNDPDFAVFVASRIDMWSFCILFALYIIALALIIYINTQGVLPCPAYVRKQVAGKALLLLSSGTSARPQPELPADVHAHWRSPRFFRSCF